MKRPTIVCLCGSTKFGKFFADYNLKFTLEGKIVLSIGCNLRNDSEIFAKYTVKELEKIKKDLDKLHKRKIDLADEVFILNVDNYIGESTRSEIEYAEKHKKKISYLVPVWS